MSPTEFSLKAPLPESIRAHRTAYAGGTSSPNISGSSTASTSLPLSALQHSKSHLTRSQSSSPSETAQTELEPSSPRSNPLAHPEGHLTQSRSPSPSPAAQTPPNTSSASPPPSLSLSPSSPSPQPSAAQPTNSLPKSAYNYQPYQPRAPPPVQPWTRKQLYSQLVSISAPVFLSCNLTNPVHLASILAHGCEWDVVEQVAEGMTPAVLGDRVNAGVSTGVDAGVDAGVNAGVTDSGVEGVLVGGLVAGAMERLSAVFQRRYTGRAERVVEEVSVWIEDGAVVAVAAYVYRRA